MPENKPIEAVKVAYQQVKDGLKLVLVIHPDDMPDWLALAPLGQRMSFAAVPIKDEEAEHGQGEKARPSWSEHSAVRQAAIRCNDAVFQGWAFQKYPFAHYPQSWGATRVTEQIVRDWCGVESRADILPGTAAERKWHEMDRRYIEETRLPEQRDGAT